MHLETRVEEVKGLIGDRTTDKSTINSRRNAKLAADEHLKQAQNRFGTLDADTLESVSQVLESLQKQDRLIGVITHVRALGERLPTQVKVHKSPEGSRLEVEAF